MGMIFFITSEPGLLLHSLTLACICFTWLCLAHCLKKNKTWPTVGERCLAKNVGHHFFNFQVGLESRIPGVNHDKPFSGK